MFSLMAYFAVSCFGTVNGNGNIKKQTYDVSSFKAIEISGAFNVVLKQSDKESATIIADENLINSIKVESKNNVLKIGTSKMLKSKTELKLIIEFIDINSLDIEGASKVINDSIIKTDRLEVEFEGAVTATLNIEVRNFELDIKGASIVEVSGSTDYQDIDISGVGVLKANKLISRKTEIEVSGSSKAFVNATELLDVEINGTSEVKYSGNPSIKQKITGLGKLAKEQ